jgi:uncharacterized protein (TIGR03435 family)
MRIAAIIACQIVHNSSYAKKIPLAAIAITAAAGPIAIGILHAPSIRAQSPDSAMLTPTFEVASVKPSSKQERVIGMFTYPGGRLTVTNYTLRMLIAAAYQVREFQILGGPKWTGEERYSVAAMPPADSQSSKISPANPKLPPQGEELSMLRALLADRFHLAVHAETKEGRVFALQVGRKGPALAGARDKDAYPVVSYGRTGAAERPDFMEGQNASMALFAERLSRELGCPVLDQTGLKGAFDFKFEYAADLSESAAGSSLFTAIQQLGLKLAPTRGPVPHLVIDHAEKPSEN